jgi:mono/diheme cytochrome c family protein
MADKPVNNQPGDKADDKAANTTQEASVVAQTAAEKTADANAVGAQQREHGDPIERTQPIPWVAALIIVGVLMFGVGYIVLDEPPGSPAQGDRRTLADLRKPDLDAARPAGAIDGKQVYAAQCVACHQANGKGLAGVFPPLDGSEWVLGDERLIANILLHGVQGELTVAGAVYQGVMPPFKQLADAELAAVASHVRSSWSNKAAPIAAALITKERREATRTTPFAGGAELKALGSKTP